MHQETIGDQHPNYNKYVVGCTSPVRAYLFLHSAELILVIHIVLLEQGFYEIYHEAGVASPSAISGRNLYLSSNPCPQLLRRLWSPVERPVTGKSQP